MIMISCNLKEFKDSVRFHFWGSVSFLTIFCWAKIVIVMIIQFIHQVASVRRQQTRNLSVFESPTHLSITPGGGFILYLYLLNVKQKSCECRFFMVLDLTRPEIEPKSAVSEGYALSTQPLIGQTSFRMVAPLFDHLHNRV